MDRTQFVFDMNTICVYIGSMLTWDTVETLALAKGYPRKTLRMWRERGVSARARIDLYAAAQKTNIRFDILEFDRLPKAKRVRARAA